MENVAYETTPRSSSGTSSKTSLNWIAYPDGIGEAPDLQHYMVFYINVRGKSKYNTENRSSTPINTRGQNRVNPENLSNGAIAGTAVTGAIAGGAATTGPISRKIGAAAVTGAVAIGVKAGAQLSDILKEDLTYRISDVIALPLDERPSASYRAHYDNKELGTVMGLFAGGSSAVESTVGGLITEGLLTAAIKVANAPTMFTSGAGPGDVAMLSAKVTTNPFREVFFNSMDFRTFTFKYRFFPKSQTESQITKKIIDTFKNHAHPELSKNGLFYIYPSEFDIVYCFKGSENKYWHKISTCALTSINVEYGGETFSSFDDGSPTEVYLTLTFQELEILTKERMKEGY